MAYGVRQSPGSLDPRGWDFAIDGWDFGQVPPYRWTVETTAAVYPYDVFNDGVMVEAWFANRNLCLCRPPIALPNGVTCELTLVGSELPTGPAPGVTMQIYLVLGASGVDPLNGALAALYPVAIQVQEPFDMRYNGLPSLLFPNPASIEPRKWNE